MEDRGFQRIVQRICPAFRNALDPFCHAEDGADCRAVAVRVESSFIRHADLTAEISVPVKQGGDHDRRVGNGMAPVMVVVLIVFFMDGSEAVSF